jgi:Rrf2 family protein
VTLGDLAERQSISRRYLEQLATGLRNASLVVTAQGRGGGYLLQRPPEQISVAEILEAAIGPTNVVPCVAAPQLCPQAEACPSRRMWVRVNETITGILGSVSLADLREGKRHGRRPAQATTPCTSPGGES